MRPKPPSSGVAFWPGADMVAVAAACDGPQALLEIKENPGRAEIKGGNAALDTRANWL